VSSGQSRCWMQQRQGVPIENPSCPILLQNKGREETRAGETEEIKQAFKFLLIHHKMMVCVFLYVYWRHSLRTRRISQRSLARHATVKLERGTGHRGDGFRPIERMEPLCTVSAKSFSPPAFQRSGRSSLSLHRFILPTKMLTGYDEVWGLRSKGRVN